MQLISKFTKGFRFLMCVIDIFSKYPWNVPLKDVSIVDVFQEVLDDSDRKPNKMWVAKGSEFYNNSFKKWLKGNDIEMYSIHNEGKSVVSSNINKVIRPVLNIFFFYGKISQVQKGIKMQFQFFVNVALMSI